LIPAMSRSFVNVTRHGLRGGAKGTADRKENAA
jgi:hypothetical protein